jgi:hypothetical protein
MASENIGSLYPTKMPGYEDAADIQAALRLYHYGSEAYIPSNTNPEQIPPDSIAGYLKTIENDIEVLDARGVGSEYSDEEPTDLVDGFIWVDADSVVSNFSVKEWYLHDSGNLTGSSLDLENLNGESHTIILKDFYVSAPSDLFIEVNNTVILNVEGEGFETDPLSPMTIVLTIDMADTAASVKSIKTDGSTVAFYKNSLPISSFSYSITEEFASGTYEVWSYR